jgi:hypothetical protein
MGLIYSFFIFSGNISELGEMKVARFLLIGNVAINWLERRNIIE